MALLVTAPNMMATRARPPSTPPPMSRCTPAAVWSERVLAPSSPMVYTQRNDPARPANVNRNSGRRGVSVAM